MRQRGRAKSGTYNRVSRERKFLAFDLNGIEIKDVSPRAAFILLGWSLTQAQNLNKYLIDKQVGDKFTWRGVDFEVVEHKYHGLS